MKRLMLIFILIVFIFLLNAMTENQLINMQNNGELIVGKGIANTEEEADKLALQNLASQIVVTIRSSFTNIAKEENSKVEEYCESVVKTFSSIQLNNARKFTVPTKECVCVYRYITPKDKDRIFEERKSEILSFVSDGEIAEEENNVVDAIRNYYWALMLLKTHPKYKSMQYYTADNQQKLLYVTLINRIERLLSEIKIDIKSIKDTKESNCYDINLLATYKGVPADGIRIKYYDGYGWSNYEKWSDGIRKWDIDDRVWIDENKDRLHIFGTRF